MTGVLTDLTSLIEFADKQADKLFRKTGVIYPMYHAIDTAGQQFVFTPPDRDKDASVALVKAWMMLNDIDRYVFIDEAWILDDRRGAHPDWDWEKIAREGLSKHPDRREILLFAAEDRRGGSLTAKRFILRPEHGKPKLSPLEIDPVFSDSKGRMVGLLRWET